MKIRKLPKRYLLDTNILLEAIWGKEPAATAVKEWIREGQIILSPIVIGEIYSKASQKEKEKMELLIDKFGVLPIDGATARLAGEYRHQFARKKKKVFLQDCFLAAAAKLNQLTLVTHNLVDFPMKDIEVSDVS